MNFASAITLIVTVIIIYYIMVKIYSVLFRITGIAKDKAKFQSISLLTNAGYTTGESEIILSENRRRSIAIAAMLTGYFFSVVIVSLVINLFLSIDFTRLNEEIWFLVAGLGVLLLFFLILHTPSVQKAMDKVINELTVKIFRRAVKENFISVLDSYGEDAIVKIYLYKVPEFLKGKMLFESDIRSRYNVNALMFTRGGTTKHVTKSTIFSEKDIITAFGPLPSIKDAFLLRERSKEGGLESVDKVESNSIQIISNYGHQILANVQLKRVPEILKNKTLFESRIKDYFAINVMMITRGGKPLNLTKDSVFEEGDDVLAFGPYESIEAVFGTLTTFS